MKKILLPTLLGLAIYYALFGGEYSVFELRRTRELRAEEEASLEALRAETDSLRALADSLVGDSATLERIARERFGLVREGEVLYRFAEPADSSEDRENPPG